MRQKKISHLLIPMALLIGVFFLLKLSSSGVRVSDTNIYFYTAKELLHGQLLYKDLFFTNFPLVPYLAALYFFISQGNLTFYYLTATLEVITTSSIMALIVFSQTRKVLLSLLSVVTYLFSFMVLATTDHQTGVFLAALLSTLSYFFYYKKKAGLTGVFVGLALMAKAYTLPLFLTYCIIFFFSNKKQLVTFLVGSISTVVVTLLPSLLFARTDLIHDVISYSLTRAQGLSKNEIA